MTNCKNGWIRMKEKPQEGNKGMANYYNSKEQKK